MSRIPPCTISSEPAPGSIRRMLVAWVVIGLSTTALLATEIARGAKVSEARAATLESVARPKDGSLVICGGGGVPEVVWSRFVELAGGPDARILIIPTAHLGIRPLEGDDASDREWERRGAGSVRRLHARTRAEAEAPAFASPIAEATGVWIEGGNQSLLTQMYLGTEVERQLLALLDRGGVIGGSSAGAAVMTRLMITGGRTEAFEGTGFGFLSGAVVDQHFLKRNRLGRLLGVLGRHPELVGLGIDERTAVVVQGNRLSVLGDSYVMACVPAVSAGAMRPHLLRHGDRITLTSLRLGSDREIASTRDFGGTPSSATPH